MLDFVTSAGCYLDDICICCYQAAAKQFYLSPFPHCFSGVPMSSTGHIPSHIPAELHTNLPSTQPTHNQHLATMPQQHAQAWSATAAAELSAMLAELLDGFATPAVPHNWYTPTMPLPTSSGYNQQVYPAASSGYDQQFGLAAQQTANSDLHQPIHTTYAQHHGLPLSSAPHSTQTLQESQQQLQILDSQVLSAPYATLLTVPQRTLHAKLSHAADLPREAKTIHCYQAAKFVSPNKTSDSTHQGAVLESVVVSQPTVPCPPPHPQHPLCISSRRTESTAASYSISEQAKPQGQSPWLQQSVSTMTDAQPVTYGCIPGEAYLQDARPSRDADQVYAFPSVHEKQSHQLHSTTSTASAVGPSLGWSMERPLQAHRTIAMSTQQPKASPWLSDRHSQNHQQEASISLTLLDATALQASIPTLLPIALLHTQLQLTPALHPKTTRAKDHMPYPLLSKTAKCPATTQPGSNPAELAWSQPSASTMPAATQLALVVLPEQATASLLEKQQAAQSPTTPAANDKTSVKRKKGECQLACSLSLLSPLSLQPD